MVWFISAVELRSTGAITGQSDVFRFEDANACFSEGPATIGTFGTNPTDTNYVYWVLAWDSGRTKILFYYENHQNNGNVNVPPEIVYEKAVDCGGTDDSVNFLYGHKIISSTYKLKYLQFGIEGPLGMSTNGWKAREYSMTLYGTSDPGGIKSLSSLEARTAKFYTNPVDNMNHSWVTQKNLQLRAVGGAPYILDADYPAEGTATSGNVIWFYGGPLPVNTKLWP
ncbi:MAG: hypothetical protein HMLIMOIP_002527 [Candidatus Nitrosomirales archaeon]|jgi:hypothetical protein